MRMRTMMLVAAVTMLGGTTSVLAADEDPAAVFKEQCAKCHGDTGHADTPAGKMMKAPELAGNGMVAGMSVADLVKTLEVSEKHKAVLKKLSEAQITAGATRAKALAEGK